jgi:hypothetical protein
MNLCHGQFWPLTKPLYWGSDWSYLRDIIMKLVTKFFPSISVNFAKWFHFRFKRKLCASSRGRLNGCDVTAWLRWRHFRVRLIFTFGEWMMRFRFLGMLLPILSLCVRLQPLYATCLRNRSFFRLFSLFWVVFLSACQCPWTYKRRKSNTGAVHEHSVTTPITSLPADRFQFVTHPCLTSEEYV